MTDLVVDTALLKAAAGAVEDASTAFAAVVGKALGCRLTDDSLGRSAVAREVVDAAARRVQHALQASRIAADAASGVAVRIRTVAAVFEQLESAMPVPPR
ncbi:hypothetical protein ACVBEQ_03405 [Nakamurella sp. GG22]